MGLCRLDRTVITLKGNRIHYVSDDADKLQYDGAFDFNGDASNGSAFQYNANGSLITDTGKGIMFIEYDDNGMPRRIQFADGNVTEYAYTATGRKLRAVYYTAVPGITVGSGETHQLTASEILSKDSIDYLGSLVMENGVPAQYLFAGGYCSLNDVNASGGIGWHYYNRDHLGNNREVVSESGTLEQVTNYYPFGAPFCERTTAGANTNATLQRYKYNGKELDLMHGLKWYDYGARMYDPILLTWNGIDPMCEDYYPISPYAYCANNPVNRVDPDGRDWYQNEETHYYTWYNGNNKREGFIYIGGKGSVLGEFEDIIDNVLSGKDGLGMESLYSEGFTFDIAPNDKGGLIGSKDGGGNFFDEFVNGTGPEFSVLLGDHPYTETLKNESFVKRSQNIILSRGKNGKYTNAGRPQFYPWDAKLNSPMQFIGTYRYDGYSSKDGSYFNNVVTDTKSITSLVYHIPFLKNHRREQNKAFGTTFQFYIWRSKK